MTVNKERLDVALVRLGLAPSRERARALIMAGQVLVAGHLVDKPGTLISLAAECSLKEAPNELKYVSRGGLKLEKALATFGLNPEGLVALDVGASTGGFTDCLLRHGAKRVYALDVGQGQLAWTLRNDPRVDVSFISLRLVLPALVPLQAPGAWVVALVKPQFEAGKAEVDRGAGIIKDPEVHDRVVHELQEWTTHHTPFQILGLTDSPIYGRDGNREFLLYLSLG